MAGAASEGRLEKVGIESKVFEDAGAKIHEGIPELSHGTPASQVRKTLQNIGGTVALGLFDGFSGSFMV